jgi:hypothetical protein
MNSMMLHWTKVEGRRRDTLRRLCEQSMAEPVSIWELLESRGIHVTPGVIYQAISNLNKQPRRIDEDRSARAQPEEENGVSLKDMELVALIAKKAGGIRQLMHLLSTMRRVPW